MRVVGGHVEGPEELLDREASGVDRTRNPVMPSPLPGVPLVRAKMRSWEAVWTPVFQVSRR